MANDQAAAEEGEEEVNTAANTNLINTFCEITSSSKEEALFFLESHNFDLDAAVSTYYETSVASASADLQPRDRPPSPLPSVSESPPSSPSRSRSPSPPASARYNLRARRSGKRPSGSRTVGGVHTLSDLNRPSGDGSGSDSDFEPPEYNTGGEKSGRHVQDSSKINDVDSIFAEAREAGAVEGPFNDLQPSSSLQSFTGTGRLLSGETGTPASQQPEVITHNIIFWSNGFTVDGGPLQRLDDPENAPFLESIRKSECPKELEPADKRTVVHVNLTRKEENCLIPERRSSPFQGIGRTLGSTAAAEPTASTNSLNTAPPPSMSLIVDDSLPLTSIQLRLADGTRMVSRFNFHHTVRDIRAFIDASRPSGPRTYQLQTVGFPPKQLTNLDQSIEQAGLANSVVIQRL